MSRRASAGEPSEPEKKLRDESSPRSTSRHGASKRPTRLHSSASRVAHSDEEVTPEVAHHAFSHGRSRRLAEVGASASPEESTEDSRSAHTTKLRRRAHKRIRASTILIGLVAGVFSLSLMAMTHVVWAEYRLYQGEVDLKEASLNDLQDQLETGRKRLAVLQSPKGREQMLIEHGYIRPGDRILMFPATPEEQQAAAIPKNDLSPRPVERINNGAQSSAWRRAADTLSDWWQSFNAPAKPEKTPENSAEESPALN